MARRRRYESETRFWELVVDGCSVSARGGELSQQQRRTRVRVAGHGTALAARYAAERMAREMIAVGYRCVEDSSSDDVAGELRDDELEQRLVAKPSDSATARVYSDWLVAHGEPRGELIAVQTELGEGSTRVVASRRIEAKLFRDNPQFVGALGEVAPLVELAWRNGFIAAARVDPNVREREDLMPGVPIYQCTEAIVEELLGLESARFIAHLDLDAVDFHHRGSLHLVARRAPPTLRSLRIGWLGTVDVWVVGDALPPLTLPARIERLAIDRLSAPLDIVWQAELPSLRWLRLGADADSDASWAQLRDRPRCTPSELVVDALDEQGLAALLDCPLLAELRVLELSAPRFAQQRAVVGELRERAQNLERLVVGSVTLEL